MSNGPQRRGIYKIMSISTGKIYIGCSLDVKRRLKDHLSLLKHNKHNNPYLQNHYNKYGVNDLQLSIVELCDHLTPFELLLKETCVISHMGSFGNGNFNLTRGGAGYNFEYKKITCRIKNIYSGEIKEFASITDAGNFIGVDRSSMAKVLNGKKKQMRGWCSAELGYDSEEQNRKNRILYHEKHGRILVGKNITEFSRMYNLNEQSVYRLFTNPNRNKSYKGWTVNDTKETPITNNKHRPVACYDITHEEVQRFPTISSAARHFNCNNVSIFQALQKPFISKSMSYYWNYL